MHETVNIKIAGVSHVFEICYQLRNEYVKFNYGRYFPVMRSTNNTSILCTAIFTLETRLSETQLS